MFARVRLGYRRSASFEVCRWRGVSSVYLMLSPTDDVFVCLPAPPTAVVM